jgi:hypothetical protein
VKGAEARQWVEPLNCVVLWANDALELKVKLDWAYGMTTQSPEFHFVPGVAFSMIGAKFGARAHRFRSVIGDKGSSVFAADIAEVVAIMNATRSRNVVESLNPSISFQVGDVARIPLLPVASAGRVFSAVEAEFAIHEAAREASVEFCRPGPSAWTYAQSWAQLAVDRSDGAPLPPYEPVFDPPAPESFVSFALGVALGRFGANGEGILDTAPASALPNGILFVSAEQGDNLDHPACTRLVDAWTEHGRAIAPEDDLRTYLRKSFFDFHKKLYENRPIYLPLSSVKKSFVAFVSIHRWADDTLNVLLADHLVPARRRLEGELEDLRTARAAGNNKGKAEKRFAEVQKLLEELSDFIDKVTEIAENGPPPSDDKTAKREVDARFAMDLDDGVMVNSAALWPLLEPQWKDPKKWWKELANAPSQVGAKKDYDWAHLAARYFPTRARKKCHDDPSLAVAHKRFWELHPAKAYAWELRLQDEIRPDFTIDEPGSDAARAQYLKQHAKEAGEILAKELKRREKKDAKGDNDAQTEIPYDADEPEESDDD